MASQLMECRSVVENALLMIDFEIWVQYGVRINLVTSFEDRYFIEIKPAQQRSNRGYYSFASLVLSICSGFCNYRSEM